MGHLRIVLRLAWRNLWRNHRRTLIMLAAIAVGTWAMIFMTALMRGMVDDMVKDGIITKEEALKRIEPGMVDQLLRDQYDPDALKGAARIAKGLNASPGAAVGVDYAFLNGHRRASK